MKKFTAPAFITLIAVLSLLNKTKAQSYIDFSGYTHTTSTAPYLEESDQIEIENGFVYVVGIATSTGFISTNGSTFGGASDITVTKYDNNGAVIYAVYLGGNSSDFAQKAKVINGEVYIMGLSASSNYPVINGSVSGGNWDVIVTKLNTNGSIAFSTYLGGSLNDIPDKGSFEIVGNEIFLEGNTESHNFPVTGSDTFHGGANDAFITKLSATDGSILLSKCIGGDGQDWYTNVVIQNGAVYLVGATRSNDIQVTIGGYVGIGEAPTWDHTHIFVTKLNSSNFNTIYCRYIGGNVYDNPTAAEIINGEVYITGYTQSQNFPVTDGSSITGIQGDEDGFYTKLDQNGNISFSTILSTNDLDQLYTLTVSDGDTYITGQTRTNTTIDNHLVIYKFNSSNNIVYTKRLPFPNYNYSYVSKSFKVINGELYMAGFAVAASYPVTNGSQFYDNNGGYFTHFSSTGDILFSTFLGKMQSLLSMQYVNNKFYLLGASDLASYPVTDSSVISGNTDNILIVLKPDGTNIFSGYIGGASYEIPRGMAIDNESIFFIGSTYSPDYPVTNNISIQGNNDGYLTKISFCPGKYYFSNDTLSPKTQEVCKYGLATLITGKEIMVPSDSLPTIFHNGVPSSQKPIRGTKYQWQLAYNSTGPWTDIAGATLKDYRPVLGGVNQYYRRLSFSPAECGTSLIHISDTALVTVNTLTAPSLNLNGPFITCPGSAINIGGSPTATGGNPPYISYTWDMGVAAVANPSVSPVNNTLYTLIVTDTLGCSQIGQALVLSYSANAGPDKSSCAGIAVKIGAAPIPGVPGIAYNWQPATALTSTTISQPFASPVITTDYELSLSVPKSGGGFCITKDTVRVTPVAAPVTANIAGSDKVICLGDNVVLGTTAEAGFTYSWSPVDYLSNYGSSYATYNPGDLYMPLPNPATINLIANKNGCSFTDQTTVVTIESRAGYDSCGPRLIGLPDRTPNINETYSWIKISGPGNFTGATNLPQVPVTASVGGNTIYGLTVSYNGESCHDEVIVNEFCTNACQIFINVVAKNHCLGFTANDGEVLLYAWGNIPNGVYTLAPQAGLTNYTGNFVQLTDNVTRTYTVTVTDPTDSSFHCSAQILVNDPSFVKPVFPAPDVITCANVPVSIGLPPATGYTYQWTGFGLSGNSISNPIATTGYTIDYPVKITSAGGCELKDTVIVNVQVPVANAGLDWIICNNAVVELGTAAQPNTTYLWEPQASPWQNGTNQFSAQPQVLVAADVSFFVTATTSAGCVKRDSVHISIDNSPTIPDAADKTVCRNSYVQIGSPPFAGVTYQWSPVTGLTDPTIAQPYANPVSTTTYTLTATFPGLCGLPATDEVTVTVTDPSFDIPDIHFCPANGPFSLGNNAPANMSQYYWNPQNLVTNPFIANPSTLDPLPNSTTTFLLTVVDANGCRYTDSINIIPVTVAPVTGNDTSICYNQAIAIGSQANATGPSVFYDWQPVVYLNDPTSPNPTFTGITAGTYVYTLTKTDNSVSCVSKDSITIIVRDELLPAISSPTVCMNSCVQIGTSPVPGISYQWTPATGLSNQNIANPLACIGANAASYLLTASDNYGCTTTAAVVVGVNALPTPQISIPTVTACVGDTNVMFNPSVSPGNYSYLWSPDNGTLSNINIQNPEVIITGTGSTAYVLQLTDNTTGCTNTAIANLIVNNCAIFARAGNFMWYDQNNNGLQDGSINDNGETGVAGMTVKLYNNAGFNVATTVTDASGVYNFSNIPPGNDYYIVFNKPAGYDFTLQNIGGITAINNSKVDATGRSNNFNLAIGENISNIDAGIKATGTVPITLLSFTATLHNKEVLLNWQTTAEYNNHYFDVERSIDGNNFIKIGRVNGNGTTSLPHNYSLIDPHPIIGINYYRLKQVDFDGHGTYSHVVPIQLTNEEMIAAWYNNTNNTIQVNFKAQQQNVRLKLFGVNGQLIKSATTANNITAYTIDLPPLATGVYMLLVGNEKFSYSKKILISK
ncbi:MAG: SdrD B-like domain-containing protein [Ferruginibacter sp.]